MRPLPAALDPQHAPPKPDPDEKSGRFSQDQRFFVDFDHDPPPNHVPDAHNSPGVDRREPPIVRHQN